MVAIDRQACARERISRLRAKMNELGMDAFYARDVSNIAWLTAFEGVFDAESAHAAYVDALSSMLHTDSRYSAAFRRAAAGGPWDVDDASGTHAKWLHKLLNEETDKVEDAVSGEGTCQLAGAGSGAGEGDARVSVLGIEQSMTLGEFRRLERELRGALDCSQVVEGETATVSPDATMPVELKETSGLIVGLRSVKDAFELERLRAAQAVTDAAFAHVITFMRPGMTEREVQMELEDFMLRHGGDGLAFASIVATGPNGASPHAIPGDTRLEAGQCVVMDFGARAYGYCSDMTRMVFLGEPSQRLRQAYGVLREANERVEAMLRPGVTGAAAHQMAEDVLAEGGFGGKMGHSLGHGVGIDIHEEPVLAPRNTKPLQAGNVVTVEPGIYLEGEFGMRLEDCGVITDEGFDVFTRSTHEMVVI